MDKKSTFNNVIKDYEKARPGYPSELYKDIVEFSGLIHKSNVLEVGSGTGQATEYFINTDHLITGLEIGIEQAEYLSRKYSNFNNFKCICSSFEEYDNEMDNYDLIFAATSFHWIKAEIGYPKAFDLLKTNGTLAVFWHMSSIMKHNTEMFKKIRKIYSKIAPELDNSKTVEEIEQIHNLRITQFQTNNLFIKPIFKVYRWMEQYPTERYLSLLNTYSSFQMLDLDKQKAILNNVGEYIDSQKGVIDVPQEVRLYMSKK